ncbi:acyltransferase [Acidisphaera sp. L21]|uniref:acyltransferase family protein n=1 Tax=Acidisphaera sp. L21 TaxID=1641851 RepID=UPI00131ECEC5|nr:acyltransferase [Acidisphaera sp. L21]
MPKLRSLEMLRAVAALLVVLFHTQFIFGIRSGHVPFGGWFAAGNRGVDLFFVLSGFIIAYVHGADIGRPVRLGNYVYNRLVRIYPSVWIMTVPAIALYSLGFGGPDKIGKLAPSALVASTLLLPQLGDALVNVTWTLTYELFFYAVFAVIIINRTMGLALLLAWQVATLLLTLSGAELGLAGYYLRSICLEFAVGLGCAWWLRRASNLLPAPVWNAVLLTGIGAFVVGMARNDHPEWAGIACALGAGAIVVSLVRLEQAGRIRVPGVLMLLGQASYSIYLVHFSVVTLMAGIVMRLNLPVTNVLCLACAGCGVLAGVAFDRWLDRPIQQRLQQTKRVLLRPRLTAAHPKAGV